MSAESFLKEELKKIDLKLGQKLTYTYPQFPLIDLLTFAATEQVFFFESKEEDFVFLGLGKCRELDAHEVQSYLKNNPDEILVYQSLFENNELPLTYLPEWSFIQKGGEVTLSIHESMVFKSYSPSNLIFNSEVWESFLTPWTSYEEKPESDEWKDMIDSSLKLFKNKTLEKIVLSRKKIFTYDEPIESLVMFRELYLANLKSSHFSVYHQPHYYKAFISFSPERLFTLKNKHLETISLAGSALRSDDPQEDLRLEEMLMTSKKLGHEHDVVTKAISEKLKGIVEKIDISPLFTMKLPYIQHRQATIKAELKDNAHVIDIIDLLHPTPAVGGIPYKEAREKILEIEKEKRNYYAAPVGVLSQKFSEIAVGIRSALIENSTFVVFGGAGIVSGSDAEEEWIETGTKMQPFLKVLNKNSL